MHRETVVKNSAHSLHRVQSCGRDERAAEQSRINGQKGGARSSAAHHGRLLFRPAASIKVAYPALEALWLLAGAIMLKRHHLARLLLGRRRGQGLRRPSPRAHARTFAALWRSGRWCDRGRRHLVVSSCLRKGRGEGLGCSCGRRGFAHDVGVADGARLAPLVRPYAQHLALFHEMLLLTLGHGCCDVAILVEHQFDDFLLFRETGRGQARAQERIRLSSWPPRRSLVRGLRSSSATRGELPPASWLEAVGRLSETNKSAVEQSGRGWRAQAAEGSKRGHASAWCARLTS